MSFLDLLTGKKKPKLDNTFYDFKINSIDGGVIDFNTFKDKKVLIVNLAAHCGFSSQITNIEALYQQYKDNLVVLGVPSNSFMAQEPGNKEHIRKTYREEFKVTFPITEKLILKGDIIHPLYQWINSKKLDDKQFAPLKWNFHKYLVDENGIIIGSFSSSILPFDKSIIETINR